MKNILVALFAGLAITSAAQAEKIIIKGSDTLGAKLVPQLAEAYKVKNPGTTFEIAAEGSSTGIAAVIDATADLGMASRRAKTKEVSKAASKGVKMSPTVVCYDGIGVIANQGNPIKTLSLKQVEQIFTGDVTDWSAVGGSGGTISIYTRNTSSGTYSSFKKLAMSKRDYAGSSQKMAGNEQIASEVGKNPGGIGYVGMAYLKAPGIRTVPVDGSLPTVANVVSFKYPIARPCFFYTNGGPQGEAKKFVDFIFTPEGSKIVNRVGFVPAK
ncbi:MAG: phosphate ABC transporter substrate-binding protein [Verrucomicrobiota bacterium]